jgi:hypothetical protein
MTLNWHFRMTLNWHFRMTLNWHFRMTLNCPGHTAKGGGAKITAPGHIPPIGPPLKFFKKYHI